jgi:GT2 family glycosyltransferase/glycosyltransferase involved in cell wall biosynthesis
MEKLSIFFIKFIKLVLPDNVIRKWLVPIKDFILIHFYVPAKSAFRSIKYKAEFFFTNKTKFKKARPVIFISGESHTPGHIYRVERFLESFKNLGIEAWWFKPEAFLSNISMLDNCSLLIIWRTPLTKDLDKAIDRAKSKKIKVIFDLDDFMFDPDLAEPEFIDAIRSQNLDKFEIKQFYEQVNQVIGKCDFFTCPTEYLATVMRKRNQASFVLQNGYDLNTLRDSYLLINQKQPEADKIRIGYAGGTRTHQKDFGLVVPTLVKIMNEFSQTILVIFGEALNLNEFPELTPFKERIEPRRMVNLLKLQEEIARFDINIAPLEINPFCESKSELKYFEAALLQIPTVASPTETYKNIINHGVNGYLAADDEEWFDCLKMLIHDPLLRKAVGKKAHTHVLWHFGPEQRIHLLYKFLDQILKTGDLDIKYQKLFTQSLNYRLCLDSICPTSKFNYPDVPEYKTISEFSNGKWSKIGVIIPLYNYEHYIVEALNSIKLQTYRQIDVVIIDDESTDNSLQVVTEWVKKNHSLFNNCAVLQNCTNSKLSATRNVGFDYIQTSWVVQLDADNALLPEFIEESLHHIENTGAALTFAQLELFGEDKKMILETYESFRLGNSPWNPEKLAKGNYIDALAVVSKACWALAGGYDTSLKHGLEDYDFWLRFAERGLFGVYIPKVLARYRVHSNSMLRTITAASYEQRFNEIKERHHWIG